MSQGHGRDSAECREIFARLSEYLDGELPQGICDDLDGHFDGCPPCQRFLDSLRSTIRWISDQEPAPLPGDVRRRVREARARLREDEIRG